MTALENVSKRETKFIDRWLDESGHKLRLWCYKGKIDKTAFSFVVKKTIQCGNAGFTQDLEHSEKSNRHIVKMARSDSQTSIAFRIHLP